MRAITARFLQKLEFSTAGFAKTRQPNPKNAGFCERSEFLQKLQRKEREALALKHGLCEFLQKRDDLEASNKASGQPNHDQVSHTQVKTTTTAT